LSKRPIKNNFLPATTIVENTGQVSLQPRFVAVGGLLVGPRGRKSGMTYDEASPLAGSLRSGSFPLPFHYNYCYVFAV
jgi:preprotein translocase subunit SecD